MKSLSWAVLGLLMAAPSFAADNNIKMVTYFPVPYAAYGDLGVTGTCDVGLMGQCALDAGEGLTVSKASGDDRLLNTGSMIVRKGTLGLNPSSSVAVGESITAGSDIGTGILEFSHDLAVTNINSSRLGSARAMNEAQMDSLNMYGHAFPVCDELGNEISWKNLTIGNKSGVFLVCGAGEEVEETCEQNPNQEKCCTGCETWNGSACVQKTCDSGYKLNTSTCQCEKILQDSPCTWEIAYYEEVSEGTTFACGLMSAAKFIETCSNPCPDGILPGTSGGEGDGGDECFLLNERYYTTGTCVSGAVYNTYGIPALICK